MLGTSSPVWKLTLMVLAVGSSSLAGQSSLFELFGLPPKNRILFQFERDQRVQSLPQRLTVYSVCSVNSLGLEVSMRSVTL